MKIVPLMLSLIAGSILVSCQKEVTASTEPEAPQENQRLLTKIIYSETGFSFIDSFEYDAQKRCTRYLENYIDSSAGPNPGPYIYFYQFHYNGTETVPYKITDTSQGRSMNWFILYDAQKRKTADSIVYNAQEKEVIYYTYQANRIVASNNYYVSGVSVTSTKDTFDYDGNNCSRHSARIQQTGYDFWYQYSNTSFDAHINPVNKMNIANAVMFGANGTLGDDLGLNKNNYSTMSYTNSGPGGDWSSTYQYTYDSESYPLTATITVPNDPMRNMRIKYSYK